MFKCLKTFAYGQTLLNTGKNFNLKCGYPLCLTSVINCKKNIYIYCQWSRWVIDSYNAKHTCIRISFQSMLEPSGVLHKKKKLIGNYGTPNAVVKNLDNRSHCQALFELISSSSQLCAFDPHVHGSGLVDVSWIS